MSCWLQQNWCFHHLLESKKHYKLAFYLKSLSVVWCSVSEQKQLKAAGIKRYVLLVTLGRRENWPS